MKLTILSGPVRAVHRAGSVRALRILLPPLRPTPLCFGKQCMPGLARVETIAAVYMLRVEPDIEDIDKAGIWQIAGITVLLKHITQDWIVGIADQGVTRLEIPEDRTQVLFRGENFDRHDRVEERRVRTDQSLVDRLGRRGRQRVEGG